MSAFPEQTSSAYRSIAKCFSSYSLGSVAFKMLAVSASAILLGEYTSWGMSKKTLCLSKGVMEDCDRNSIGLLGSCVMDSKAKS